MKNKNLQFIAENKCNEDCDCEKSTKTNGMEQKNLKRFLLVIISIAHGSKDVARNKRNTGREGRKRKFVSQPTEKWIVLSVFLSALNGK